MEDNFAVEYPQADLEAYKDWLKYSQPMKKK